MLDLLLPTKRRRDTSISSLCSDLGFYDQRTVLKQTLFVTDTEDWNVIRSTQSLNAFLQFLMQEDLDHFMDHKIQKITEKPFSTKKAQRLASTLINSVLLTFSLSYFQKEILQSSSYIVHSKFVQLQAMRRSVLLIILASSHVIDSEGLHDQCVQCDLKL